MEAKLKKCEVCKTEAMCLCFECMSYFCDSCFKFSHKNEENKSHKKENIDYFVPIDLKCPEHKLHPMDLFCVQDKGNYLYIILIYNIELCCPYCLFENLHNNHKILKINDEESLKKENITIEFSNNEFDENVKKLNNLKNLIENEMEKIDKRYEELDKETTNSYEIKREKLNKEENDLKEKLKTEVTKIKEKFEIKISEISSLLKNCEKIFKGIKTLEKHEKNIIKNLSYISKINKNKKETNVILQELMKNLNIKFIEEENLIKYEEYYFSGIPHPKNIEIKDIGTTGFKILWKIDDINILNIDKKEIKYRVEIKKENSKEDFQQIYEGNENNYSVNKLMENTNYEIRICSLYKNIISKWSEIYKVKTANGNPFMHFQNNPQLYGNQPPFYY